MEGSARSVNPHDSIVVCLDSDTIVHMLVDVFEIIGFISGKHMWSLKEQKGGN